MDVDELVSQIKQGIRLAGHGNDGSIKLVGFKLVVRTVLTSTVGGGFSLRVPFVDATLGPQGDLARSEMTTIALDMFPRPTDIGASDSSTIARSIADAIDAVRTTVRRAQMGQDPWDLQAGSVDIEFSATSKGSLSFGVHTGRSRNLTNTLTIAIEPTGPNSRGGLQP